MHCHTRAAQGWLALGYLFQGEPVAGQHIAVGILWMVLTRRLFKVEDDGGAHEGGLAVRRFEQIDPEPGAGVAVSPVSSFSSRQAASIRFSPAPRGRRAG